MPSPKWYRVKRQNGTWSKWYRSAALAGRAEEGQVFQWSDKRGEPVLYGQRQRKSRGKFPAAPRGSRRRSARTWEDRANLHSSIYADPEGARDALAKRGIRAIDPVSPKVHSLADAAESAIDSQSSQINIHQESTLPGTRVFVTDMVQVTHHKTLDRRDARVNLFIRISPKTGRVRGYKVIPMKYGKRVRDGEVQLPADASRAEIIGEMQRAYERL